MIIFLKKVWTVPLKNNFSQTLIDAFSQTIKTSKRIPNMLKTDDGNEYLNNIFKELLKENYERFSLLY